MAYPHTGSQLDAAGKNTTRTAVSTNIIIQVDGNPVGAIQTLNIDESRQIAQIDEVGTDGHIDSVPKSSTNITGSCERIRFDNMRLAAAFSRGFVHVSSQRVPFDIVILDIFAADESEADGFNASPNVITTTLKNVWISKLSYAYKAGDFTISENMGWEAEHIYSYIGDRDTSSVPAVNARVLPLAYSDPWERQADVGKRRGALDAAGMLSIIDSIT